MKTEKYNHPIVDPKVRSREIQNNTLIKYIINLSKKFKVNRLKQPEKPKLKEQNIVEIVNPTKRVEGA